MSDFIDFIKDMVTILIGGIIQNGAEIKVSEKRKNFFKHKNNRTAAVFFYGSLIAVVVLIIFGIVTIVKGKSLGIIPLIGGIGLGLLLIVEWGKVE